MKSGIYSPNLLFGAVVLLLLVLVVAPRISAGGMYPPALWFGAGCLLIMVVVAYSRLGSWWRGRHRPTLTPLQVEELLLGQGALVVDLRDQATFRRGHIRGCLHVPFAELATRLQTPDPAARRPLVLVDETDALSHRALDLLTARGFDWLYVLKGGMRAWRRESRPVAK
jgi:rhodanese-related sulfurtransferase